MPTYGESRRESGGRDRGLINLYKIMIQLPSVLTSYRDKVDGSASLTFATRELSDEEIIILRKFRSAEGWLLFKENPISEDEVPKEEAEIEGKTASQRLYNVLFKLWKEHNISDDFEVWRRKEMEKLISLYKSKIDG
jgi:hypothetical protein